MCWIIGVVENSDINAVCKFGDSGGDMVIDAEGCCSVSYCFVPNDRFNQKLTIERRSMRTHDCLGG